MSDTHPEVVMTDAEAKAFVVGLLKDRGPLSTMEIEMSAREHRTRCPDQTVLYLTKLMHRGVIHGEVSVEKRGWVWWLPKTQTPSG